MTRPSILIVDDEKNTREGLLWSFDESRYDLRTAADGLDALEKLRKQPVDLLITDLKMPRMDGMALLKAICAEFAETMVVVLTGHGSVEGAVEAMQKGAYNYLIKPVNLDELHQLVDRALAHHALQTENKALHEQLEERHGMDNIIGQSKAMQLVFERVGQVAVSRASVLLTGASGTGKEVIASAIHYKSDRHDKPFIKLNCGALTTTLLESELFGHEAGAFTDARKQKIGRFERADGGTIFLDEITETAAEFQVKLLRVLQEQEFERVGGIEPIRVDVRIIAATNTDIEQQVRDGKFREDLYYRLNVVKINLPPLSEREEDIVLMAQAFLEEFCKANKKKAMHITPKAMQVLRQFSWPGNVRQLRNVIEGLVVLSTGKEINENDLSEEIRDASSAQNKLQLQVGSTVADMEKELIRATLLQTGGNRAAAAKQLGIARKTLYRKIEEYGLSGKS